MKNYHNNKFSLTGISFTLIFWGVFGNPILSEGQVLPPFGSIPPPPGNIPPPPSGIPSFPGGIPAPPSVVQPGVPVVPSLPPPASVVPPPANSNTPAPPNAGVPTSKDPTTEPIFEETGFIGGAALFSDPAELSGIEGLDEDLDRIKLRDLPAKDALEMLQLWTGRYILRPQNLPQVQLNFDSFNILTKREALMAIESLLTMNGIAMTKIDNLFWKAVPALGVNAQVPIWLEGPTTQLAPSQRIYIKMFHLLYAPAVEVREQLNSFATPNVSTLLVFEKANSILITDSLLNLQRMEKLLETIDRPIRKEDLGTEFFVWETQHAGARELETKLKTMIEGSLKPFLGGTTQVDSDDRTGKLLVVTRSQNLETIQFILETLDAPVKMKTSSTLYKLQHAEAKDIQAILDEVIKNQQRIKQQVQGRKSASARPQAANSGVPRPPTPGGAAKPAASTASSADAGSDGSHEFSDFITISADERSNAILVYGTKADIEEIGRMIESLDHPLPLARIDTIFVMVDLTEQNQRGIDALFKNLEWSKYDRGETGDGLFGAPNNGTVTIDQPAGSDPIQVSGNVVSETFQGVLGVPGLGSSIPFQMHDWKLSGIRWDQLFSLSAERNDVRIFSTPSLMVSHNAPEVHILIQDERNIIVPTYGYNSTSTTGESSTGQRDTITAKTELQIKKPKIGLPKWDENGTIISPGSIFMEIEVTAEKFDETVTNTFQGQSLPSKKIREAKSFVTIQDGEILVLGGLQEVQVDSTESSYQLLSSIPYFGKKFFQPTTVKYTPTELLIFLRPTIIKPGENKTEDYIQQIDERLSPHYKPRFTSPSGSVLNPPETKNSPKKRTEFSQRDEPSPAPLINFGNP